MADEGDPLIADQVEVEAIRGAGLAPEVDTVEAGVMIVDEVSLGVEQEEVGRPLGLELAEPLVDVGIDLRRPDAEGQMQQVGLVARLGAPRRQPGQAGVR